MSDEKEIPEAVEDALEEWVMAEIKAAEKPGVERANKANALAEVAKTKLRAALAQAREEGTKLMRAALRYLLSTDRFFEPGLHEPIKAHDRVTCARCAWVVEQDDARSAWEGMREEQREYLKLRAQARPQEPQR